MRPPDDLLCELVFREIRQGQPDERIFFVDNQYQIVATFQHPYERATLQKARTYWEEELLAVVTINRASIMGQVTVVEYLPQQSSYTSLHQRLSPWWDDEPNQAAIETAMANFEEGET